MFRFDAPKTSVTLPPLLKLLPPAHLSLYYEARILTLAPSAQMSVGLSTDGCLESTELPGNAQNSLAMTSGGAYSRGIQIWDEAVITEEFAGGAAFAAGDTIGCGVAVNTYSKPTVYFTHNGRFLGFTQFSFHPGMDFCPAIGASAPTGPSASASINTGTEPFVFDLSAFLSSLKPCLAEDGRGLIETIPDELLRTILFLAVDKPHEAGRLALVSHQFEQAASDNLVWKTLFLAEWPDANCNMRLKSWRNFFKSRFEAVVAVEETGQEAHPIENCAFEFVCPMIAERLATALADAKEAFCSKCEKTVYKVETKEELKDHASRGHCVAFYSPYSSSKWDEMLGGVYYEPDEYF